MLIIIYNRYYEEFNEKFYISKPIKMKSIQKFVDKENVSKIQ